MTEDDNKLFGEVEVQLADAQCNTHQSEHWLSFSARTGPALYVMEKKFIVQRDNLELPVLTVNITGNETITYDDT